MLFKGFLPARLGLQGLKINGVGAFTRGMGPGRHSAVNKNFKFWQLPDQKATLLVGIEDISLLRLFLQKFGCLANISDFAETLPTGINNDRFWQLEKNPKEKNGD